MLNEIVLPLMNWYESVKRDLPWRKQKNPYYIWVSEIMLQQTRVEAVKPFFERFVSSLPTIQALAACPEDTLLKLWEGLGYYNRVRNMQKAAQILVNNYEGKLPASYDRLLELPGIGSYTAGAIGSIGFDLPVPAVDGNVLRVISRVTENYDDIMKQSVRRRVEEQLQKIMPVEGPGVFNQGLMELGATVCIPNGMAKCEVCPLKSFCLATQHDTVMQLPVKTSKKARKIEKRTVLVIQDGQHVAIRKRVNKGLLAGLYELPNLLGHLTEEEVLATINEYKLEPIHIQQLEATKHIFSHIEWQMIGYRIRISDVEHALGNSLEEISCKENGQYTHNIEKFGKNKNIDLPFLDTFIFANQETVESQYSIPSAFAKYMETLNIRIGQDKYE